MTFDAALDVFEGAVEVILGVIVIIALIRLQKNLRKRKR